MPHPVDDVPQTFQPASSYQVRDELEKFLTRDLLGPWGDVGEVLPEHGPRDRYLVGMLGPKPEVQGEEQSAATAEVEDEPGENGGADDGELSPRPSPQAVGRIWASSMGMSFLVLADVGLLNVTAAWGRYVRTRSTDMSTDTETGTEQETGKTVCQHEPVTHDVDINVSASGQHSHYLEGDARSPRVRLDVRVRERAAPAGGAARRVVEVALVNALEDTQELADRHWLFQTHLQVTAFPDASTPVFLPIDDPLDDTSDHTPDDPEEQRLRLLYRDKLRHAVGRNVAVCAKVRKNTRKAHRLTTTWLPTHETPATSTKLPGQGALQLGMDELAELAVPARTAELKAALRPLTDGYATWLRDQQAAVRDKAARGELSEQLRHAADFALDQAEQARERIASGIDTLCSDATALEAFRFANRAMALQRRTTEIANLRSDPQGGPRTAHVPARATAQVLVEVIREAHTDLLAMTYSARPYRPVTEALRDAVRRGVRVDLVVETKDGAAGLLGGPEPAAAFTTVPGVHLWHWPAENRAQAGARQHAKIAVADSRLLFLGSANLTASGATRNIEAGVLVRGGTAPSRAADHVRELQRTGVLRHLADP